MYGEGQCGKKFSLVRNNEGTKTVGDIEGNKIHPTPKNCEGSAVSTTHLSAKSGCRFHVSIDPVSSKNSYSKV
jgi:hypothetical protein